MAVFSVAVAPVSAPQPASVEAKPVKVALRRITETQYRHTIADVFGPSIKINARFEPEQRVDRLLALGSAQLSLTSAGFEQYFVLAGSISDQVLSEQQRAASVRCKPADPSRADDACARVFIEEYGERLFRRPLTRPEILARLHAASAGAKQSGDFYAGLKLALTSLLLAPEFLFRVETAEPDPAHPRQYRLDGYTKAARLSFLLWDSAPDHELLASARTGAIHTEAGLKRQLNRMVASPRFEDGVRAFFTDMLQLDGIENLVKDPAIYPKFNQSVADSAKEQTLRTAIDLLVRKRRDYRDLFTSNDTFINRPLASVYRVPFASSSSSSSSSSSNWAPYTFPPSSERSGILTEVSFLSLFAHPGTSSPTKRGIKLYEIFMCQGTPDPPADVDFSRVQDSSKGTVRARLLDHMQNVGCAVCHRRTDPPGLALEHFDGLGQLRTTENGTPIDVSAGINGVKFDGAQGLGQFLHDDPRVPECLVRTVYAYGAGREIDDEDYLVAQTKAFAGSGYRFPDLMVEIASSPAFFKVVVPSGAEPRSPTASAETAPPKQSKGVVP